MILEWKKVLLAFSLCFYCWWVGVRCGLFQTPGRQISKYKLVQVGQISNRQQTTRHWHNAFHAFVQMHLKLVADMYQYGAFWPHTIKWLDEGWRQKAVKTGMCLWTVCSLLARRYLSLLCISVSDLSTVAGSVYMLSQHP